MEKALRKEIKNYFLLIINFFLIFSALLKMLLDWFGRKQVDPDWLECEHWEPAKILANERANGRGLARVFNLILLIPFVHLAAINFIL